MSIKPVAGLAVSALVLALLHAVPAPAEAQRAGNFQATVTAGALSPAKVSGFAVSFGSRADNWWYTQLVTPGGASSFLMAFAGAVRPPLGEHQIGDYVSSGGEPPIGKFIATGNVDPQLFVISGLHSLSGKVVITASTASEVEGTFSYRARQAANGQVVNVSGTFKTSNQEQ